MMLMVVLYEEAVCTSQRQDYRRHPVTFSSPADKQVGGRSAGEGGGGQRRTVVISNAGAGASSVAEIA